MFEKKGQCGFSLMEVLFSIVVLSLGLVFVAALFPVGISYNRVVTETTMGDIETHNAGVMAELQIDSGCIGPRPGFPGIFFVDTTPTGGGPGGVVRFLCQPNVRRDSGDILMDDPTDAKFTLIPPAPAEYVWYNPGVKDDVPTYLSPDLNYGLTLARRNIGTLVSPAVTMRDRAVERYLQKFGDYYPDNFWYADSTIQFFEQMDEAMHAVSMERKNSCSYLYQCLDTNDKTFRFLIFYLKIDQRNRRYAMQNDWNVTSGNIDDTIVALPATQDRLFPVPWRIYLDAFAIGPPPPGVPYPDRFQVAPELVDFFHPGGFIVDADNAAYPDSGLVYEIIDVSKIEINQPLLGLNMGNYLIRLRTELQNDLQYFWVFPPSIDAGSRQFRDVQPVIKVAEKVIDF